MSDIFYFGKVAYVSSGIHVELDFTRFSRQFVQAQWWLGNQVLNDCKPYMPMRTGGFIQRSYVEEEGRRVVFPGPSGRFLYGGLVMVDPETGSPWARPGATKVVTDRKLTYSNPMATDHWFDTAKNNHGTAWVEEVKRIGGGG